MKKRFSIGARIAVTMGIVLVVVMAAIFLVIASQMQTTLESLMKSTSQSLLDARGDQIDQIIANKQQLMQIEASLPVFVSGNRASVEEEAYSLLQDKSMGTDVASVFIVWPDGQATTTPGNYISIADRDYVKSIFGEGNTVSMSAPLVSRNTQKPAIMMLHAIQGSNGATRAAMAIEMGLDAINDIIEDVSIGETSTSWLIDKTGLIFCSSNPDLVMKTSLQTIDKDFGFKGLSALANTIMNNEEFAGAYFGQDGSGRMVYTNRVSEVYNWRLGVSIDTSVFLQPLTRLEMILAIVIVAGLVIAVLVAIFLGGRIRRTLKVLGDTLKVVAQGDFTDTVVIKSNDEIGDLGTYLNETVEKIKELILTIKNQASALFDVSNELTSDMSQTAKSMSDITANIQSIKGRVINQSASVTETNATMQEISTNIEQLNENVAEQNESVAQSSSAIEEMIANIQSVTNTLVSNVDNVKSLTDASDVGHTGLQQVSQSIQEIAKESAGLLEINAVMENIASQTNLLSMNAAIEAAHAGEAGKGFAVVADEIRKLAESSNEQSKTISQVLKKIKSSIDNITAQTDNVLAKFEAITGGVKLVADQEDTIKNAMEEQSAGSKQVLVAIEKLNELTQNVKNSSEVMLEGSKQVITESQNLEKVTAEITNSVNEMASGAQQINSAVSEVNHLTDQNQDGIDVLVEGVSKFKVERLAFDYDLIVAKHRAWIANLRKYMDGELQELKAGPDDHKNCALGKWVYGDGKQFEEISSYSILEEAHHQFHEKAAVIIGFKDENNILEAEKEYKALMELYHKIMDALNDLKEKTKKN
ncbi:MAG: methyl-accepting chemotaxis protein [Spirochaetaceae bacterium]|nr:methyl-accepting chemotaxis protein [Spirochaetaceae bacterium]